MKALGLSFGRKDKNSDIMVKQVLKQLKANGCEVKFIHTLDLDLQPCSGCTACVGSLMSGGRGDCVLKDDFHIIDEAFMEADIIVVCAPIFCLSPTGQFKILCDRMGPSHDFSFRTNALEVGKARGLSEDKLVDPRTFKKRVAALMTVGGARTKHWTSFGIPTMYQMFANGMQVVDVYNAYNAMGYDHMIGNKKLMERLTKMGDNLFFAASHDIPEDYWCGDEEGVCPVCHQDMLTILHDKMRVECPICGIEGTLKVVDGEIKVDFPEEQIEHSRLRYLGKLDHYIEIRDSDKNPEKVRIPNLNEVIKEFNESCGF